MSENKFIYIALAVTLFVALTLTDFKIARAIKAAQVAPASATPAAQPQVKCDTIIRTGDTIFMYIKNK